MRFLALDEYTKGRQNAYEYVMKFIIDPMPSADVVEVVRCKDCKHRLKEWRGDKRLKNTGYWSYGCKHFAELMGYWGWGGNDNDFCSYGERRTDDGN